jgi:hypothetical protein
MCLGTWGGVLIGLFIYFISPEDWETKYFLLPLVSSLLSWLADPIIGIAYRFETKLMED